MSFKATIFLLIVSLEDLSIDVIRVLKSPPTTVIDSLSLYVDHDLLYILRASNVGSINVYQLYFLVGLLLLSLCSFLFVSYYSLCLKVYIVIFKYCYPSFFSLLFAKNIFLHPFNFCLCVFFILRWIS